MMEKGSSLKHAMRPIISFVLICCLITTSVFMTVPKALYAAETPYIFGSLELSSTYTSGKRLKDSFYYSDSWFLEDPAKGNDSLALMSMQLVGADIDDTENGPNAGLLKQLGFDQFGFQGFHSDDTDDCAYTWAKKTVGQGTDAFDLVLIIMDSYTYDLATKQKGWIQNFTVNDQSASGEHAAFDKATDIVIDHIAGLAGESSKVKFWITGHSRGGALANLLSAKLPEKLGQANQGIYGYTFEAPSVIEAAEGQDIATGYAYIHNYYCDDDLVTMLPPPAWGLRLYGVYHKINTAEADSRIDEQLKRLGSDLELDIADSSTVKAADILEKINSRIPTRLAYSSQNKDTVTDAAGQQIQISYSYQEKVAKLIGFFVRQGMPGVGLFAYLNDLINTADPFVRGYMAELGRIEGNPDSYYWEAAGQLCQLLKSMYGEEVDFTLKETDIYALLKVIAPLVIDTSESTWNKYTITEDPISFSGIFAYLGPGLNLYTRKDALSFSHQQDSIIARLKTFAPAPEINNIALEIDGPNAGDALSKAPEDVAAAVKEMGYSWLEGKGQWDSEDASLAYDKKYCLTVTLAALGHEIAKDIVFTLNGKTPEAAPEIYYENGNAMVKATFAFTFAASKDNYLEPPTKDTGSDSSEGQDLTEDTGSDSSEGQTLTELDKKIKSSTSDKDIVESSYLPLQLKSAKQTKKTISLSWKKASGASSYVIYGGLSGKKMTKVATVSKNNFTVKKLGKKLKKGKYYKFILVAVNQSGKVVSVSKIIHVSLPGARTGNYKAVKAPAKVSVKAGKTLKLKLKLLKPAGKKVKRILGLRYASSDPAIARVSAKGLITGVKKGSCKLYAYTQSGTVKSIKVTIK